MIKETDKIDMDNAEVQDQNITSNHVCNEKIKED